MKKQFFLIPVILALILCLPFLTGSVMADEPEFVDSGTCGENLTWTLDSEGTLTISGEGDMYNYGDNRYNSGKPAPWSSYRSNITHVVVESGVTSIGNCAFGQYQSVGINPPVIRTYSSIQTVSLPDTVISIGDNAFSGCQSLQQINMPTQLNSVGVMAFFECSALTHIEFPDTCVTLGYSLLENCINLKSVRLPEGLEAIPNFMVAGCDDLEAIDIPDTVTSIGGYAFHRCYSLKEIVIPAGVTEIADYTFPTFSLTDSFEELSYTIKFLGNAPVFGDNAFYNAIATVYYPGNDDTWTPWINQHYGGFLTWIPFGEEPTILYGDANQDNEIDGKDLILLRQHLAGWDVTVSPDSADANGDGEVDGKDLILLRQHLAGWDVVLGPKPEESHSILGTWVYVAREDWEGDNVALIDINYMKFNADGTGWNWFENWSNYDLLHGRPAEGWVDITPPYSDNSFTYTLEGDRLTVTYAPIEDFEIEAETKVYTLAWNEDGSLTIHYPNGDARTHKLLPRDNMSLEELLELFGLDPNVPEN